MGFLMIGAFTAAGCGVLVAATDATRSIEELPLWRMALFGALAGAVFPPIFVMMKFADLFAPGHGGAELGRRRPNRFDGGRCNEGRSSRSYSGAPDKLPDGNREPGHPEADF